MFSEYYRIEQDHALFDDSVMESIVFAEHNLGNRRTVQPFQAFSAGGVWVRSHEWLQERVHALFIESLSRSGVLALGIDGLPKLPFTQRYERLPVIRTSIGR